MHHLPKSLVALAAGFAVAGSLSLPVPPPASAQSGPGWTTLVDDKTMGDWNQVGEANWRMEGGALVADKGKGGHLVSKQSYKNFQMHVEFYAEANTNSGIFMRCTDPKSIGAKTCYEVNIWDTRKDPSYGTGAVVNFAEVNPMPKAGGKWNTFEITANGRHITVVMNGQKTADFRNGMFEEGPFTLQFSGGDGGGGPIKFRKVAIKPL